MAIEDLLLIPYEHAVWQGSDFSAWTKPDGAALWNVTPFSSLIKGRSTLWHHNPGTGTFPNQSVDPDYNSTRDNDLIDSPAVDFSSFASADNWHVRVRIIWRPEHVLSSIVGIDQQPEKITIYALTATGAHVIGILDQPILDPAGVTDSVELSRVEPDGGNPNVGADGLWWYQQAFAPPSVVQEEIIGQTPVTFQLSLQVADRDASGYGTGIEKFVVEIMRGAVADTSSTFPIHLHRSYFNQRRWVASE